MNEAVNLALAEGSMQQFSIQTHVALTESPISIAGSARCIIHNYTKHFLHSSKALGSRIALLAHDNP